MIDASFRMIDSSGTGEISEKELTDFYVGMGMDEKTSKMIS